MLYEHAFQLHNIILLYEYLSQLVAISIKTHVENVQWLLLNFIKCLTIHILVFTLVQCV